MFHWTHGKWNAVLRPTHGTDIGSANTLFSKRESYAGKYWSSQKRSEKKYACIQSPEEWFFYLAWFFGNRNASEVAISFCFASTFKKIQNKQINAITKKKCLKVDAVNYVGISKKLRHTTW